MIKYHFLTSLAILMFSMCSMSIFPSDNYKDLWKRVSHFEKDRLPKSALETVELIYAKSVKDGNEIQRIKSDLYRVKLTIELYEDGFEKAVDIFNDEIAELDGHSQNILYSAQATLYQNYLNNNLYQINQRTNIDGFDDRNPKSWPVKTLVDKISDSFLASIQEPDENKREIEEFKELLVNYDKSYKPYLPTLHDLLVSRALQFFSSNRTYLSSPHYKFDIDSKRFLSSHQDFVAEVFNSDDETSLLYKAILVFQNQLSLHQPISIAGAEANLNRLDLVYAQGSFEEKDQAYLERLEELEQSYKELPQYTEVLSRLAQYYYNKGSEQDGPLLYPDAWKLALSYCEKAISHDKKSYGTGRCMGVYNNILAKRLSLQTEQFYTVEETGLIHLTYKNIETVFFKIYPFSQEEYRKYQESNSKNRIDILKRMKALNEWNEKLPTLDNFYSQSIELDLPSLQSGTYAIVLSENEKYQKGGSISSVSFFSISDLTYSHQSMDGHGKIYVVNRISGKPIADAEVTLFTNKYDRDRRSSSLIKVFSEKTSLNGDVTVPENITDHYRIQITKGEDILLSNNNHSNRRHNYNQPISNNTVIFTDRSIYRPGQTVFFKALALSYDGEGIPKIRTNEKLNIELRDANGQRVGNAIELMTNEFGSCNGNFVAPSSGLNGLMSILVSTDGSRQNISVEEYKRPKFEVKTEPLTASYRLGDSIEVDLSAISYAGVGLSGASANFSVKRQSYFPYYRRQNRRYFSPYQFSTPMQISNGTMVLDKDGKGKIRFKAIGDMRIEKSWNPVYSFSISIEVVDLNGETQTTTSNINIGAQSRNVTLDIDAVQKYEDIDSIEVVIQDLNQSPQEGKGIIKVFELEEPQNVFNKRYWAKDEAGYIDGDDFRERHPWYNPFQDGMEHLKIKGLVEEIHFNSQSTSFIKLKELKPSGLYKFQITLEESSGDEIQHVQYCQIYSHPAGSYPKVKHLYYDVDKQSYEPGDQVLLSIGYPSEALAILYRLEKKGSIKEERWLGEESLIRIPVNESDRGGFDIHLHYFKNNRHYAEKIHIDVPWSNKNLTISYETFRDKVLPGSEEEFRIKISGNKKEVVAAEFLAGMYDASLDAFKAHDWSRPFYRNNYSRFMTSVSGYYATHSNALYNKRYIQEKWNGNRKVLPSLGLLGESYYFRPMGGMGYKSFDGLTARAAGVMEEAEMDAVMISSPDAVPQRRMAKNDSADYAVEEMAVITNQDGAVGVPIRKNLKETVFFYPDLRTDANGDLILSFKMNEALTKWKLMSFAHTKELEYGFDQREIVTQKKLMVVPSLPRFVRDKDLIKIQTKISNLTDKPVKGQVRLELLDAVTMQPLDYHENGDSALKAFNAEANGSSTGEWWVRIPERDIDLLMVRIIAQAGAYSDGEENIIPVLTNKVLVTETMPLTAKPQQKSKFVFDRLAANKSTSLIHKGFALEYTNNPAWYAVQALPYMMEYPHQCTEQIFNKFYANSLASHISNSHPRIKAIFESWRAVDSDALVSNLEKNQELKSALIEETPWVFKALDESQQKKQIALLFDLNRMSHEREVLIKQMKERQNPDGGYSWFPRSRSDRYISQYLLEGIGHLSRLEVLNPNDEIYQTWIKQLLTYVDESLWKKYKKLENRESKFIDQIDIHYLYARSFFLQHPVNETYKEAFDYYLKQAEQYGLGQGIYASGMVALALHRYEKTKAAQKIYDSLIERSLTHNELGMYWNEGNGYRWFELPIERHALMIEVNNEIGGGDMLEELKLWLLRNKQTNNWKTTKATAAAIYALLLEGENATVSSWIIEDNPPSIHVAGSPLDLSKSEAGTGYLKTTWTEGDVTSDLAIISIENNNNHLGWGASYWTYFEDMNKVTSFKETPLNLSKELYKVVVSDYGEKLVPLNEDNVPVVGDLIRVRIELHTDRSMEYLHLKDMRASGLEPVDVISGNKFTHGLSYYQSTRDQATDFFIHYLPKGDYVFEYNLRVQHVGNFSNGISSIQSMYAPEYTSHSAGIELVVK